MRGSARKSRRVARWLAAAEVDIGDRRQRGGSALTEPVVLLDGVHRSLYALLDRDERNLGIAVPIERCPPAYRACYELLLAPDGARLATLLIAHAVGPRTDVIRAADNTEVMRLQRTDLRTEPSEGANRPPRRRLSALGFGPRWIVCGERSIGQLRKPDGHRWTRARVVTDASGAEVARVTRVRGGVGPGGTEHTFIIDLRDGTDDRLRVAALLAGILWDWHVISWDPGG
jgi:hypothetical protein